MSTSRGSAAFRVLSARNDVLARDIEPRGGASERAGRNAKREGGSERVKAKRAFATSRRPVSSELATECAAGRAFLFLLNVRLGGSSVVRYAAPRNQHPRNRSSTRRLREIGHPRLGGSAVSGRRRIHRT